MNSTSSSLPFPAIAGILLLHSVAPALAAESPPGSVTLDALVEEVAANNPELAFYRAEIDAAIRGRRQAGIYANPEISAGVARKRVHEGGLSSEGTAWSVSVVQTFEFPGRMALRKAIANRDVQLAELGLAQFQAALRGTARTLGFNLLVAQQKAETTSGVADRLQELLSFLVQREPGGITPLIELRIIEASVATFRKRSIDASQALQAALFDVNLIRGKPIETPLRIAEANPSFPEPPPLRTLLSEARENSFDIRMRRVELDQQGLRLALSRNQRWPEISVDPFVERESAKARETVAGIGISLPLPAWDRPCHPLPAEDRAHAGEDAPNRPHPGEPGNDGEHPAAEESNRAHDHGHHQDAHEVTGANFVPGEGILLAEEAAAQIGLTTATARRRMLAIRFSTNARIYETAHAHAPGEGKREHHDSHGTAILTPSCAPPSGPDRQAGSGSRSPTAWPRAPSSPRAAPSTCG